MRIGEILVERGAVTAQQVEEALALAPARGARLGAMLFELGHVDIDEVARALAQQKGIPSLRFEYFKNADPSAVHALPPEVAARYFAAAVGFKNDGEKKLVVALRDPDNTAAIRAIAEATGYPVIPTVVSEALLRKTLARFYNVEPHEQGSAEPALALVPVLPDRPAGTMASPDAASARDPRDAARDSQDEPEAGEVQVVDGVCAGHADRATHFVCPQCRAEWCLDCGDHHWTGKGFIDRCRRCKCALVVPAGRRGRTVARAAGRGFAARLPELARFPFTSSGLVLLIGLTVIAVVLDLIQTALAFSFLGGFMARAVRVFLWGFELTILFGILTATAEGRDEIEMSDIIRLDESVYEPIKRFGAAYLPLLAALIWWAFSLLDQSVLEVILGGAVSYTKLFTHLGPATFAVLIGVALLPLLIMVAAVSTSPITVLNPSNWLRLLRALGRSYLLGGFCFYVVFAGEFLVLMPVLAVASVKYHVPVLTGAVVMFIGYIFTTLRMRILGGLLTPHYGELGNILK